MESVVAMRQLTKWYGSKPAVSRFDLEVPRGAIYALLGENGAGKSTTIKMLTGLLRPDFGNATILGQDCWNDAIPLRHKVGYMPEKPRFYDWMTVLEIGWFTSGFHRPPFWMRYQEHIARFRLDPKAKLQTLSKGQYSKVALALTLAMDPEVLILDEPTSGLDLLVRRELLGSLAELASEGKTIVISSHQIAEIERVASHVAFIANGKLLLSSTMKDLRKRLVRFQLRYESQAPDAAGLGTVLERNGTGKHWQAVILDPDRSAVEAIRAGEGIFDFQEAALNLEEAYCALLLRKEELP